MRDGGYLVPTEMVTGYWSTDWRHQTPWWRRWLVRLGFMRGRRVWVPGIMDECHAPFREEKR